MIALDQTRGTPRRAQRTLVCLMLAGVVGLGHAQEGAVKTGSQEGTLVVNYYSTAPDPELEQLRGLAIDAIGVYLRGEMRVEDNDIGWSSSVRNVGKDMERIVRDLMRIRAFTGQEDFKGFSEEVAMLLVDFEELDMRDVERMRGSGTRSFEERTYVLIEQRVLEILLQCGVELGRYVNRGLLQKIGTVEQSLPVEELSRWTDPGDNVPLEPIELNFNLETMSLLDREDESTWPGEAGDSGPATANASEWQSMQDMMQRILSLVEAQEARIQALELGNPAPSSNLRDVAAQSWNPNRPSPASDPVLAALQLPASFDVQFYEGSARLTLTAQLQLNEVMEYLGMYPQLRVVCTGHADLTGDRAANLALSKKRAQAVQRHLLESGVLSTRVVLNYFGEERASNRGALDRRVEVAFFVND
jgi:outer membrane protein OmpA-like peptidoglycan-associated protein